MSSFSGVIGRSEERESNHGVKSQSIDQAVVVRRLAV
jgi:hypothetical protein